MRDDDPTQQRHRQHQWRHRRPSLLRQHTAPLRPTSRIKVNAMKSPVRMHSSGREVSHFFAEPGESFWIIKAHFLNVRVAFHYMMLTDPAHFYINSVLTTYSSQLNCHWALISVGWTLHYGWFQHHITSQSRELRRHEGCSAWQDVPRDARRVQCWH